jgi:hypothetical protein
MSQARSVVPHLLSVKASAGKKQVGALREVVGLEGNMFRKRPTVGPEFQGCIPGAVTIFAARDTWQVRWRNSEDSFNRHYVRREKANGRRLA